jgi:hypothetical protein
MNNWRSRNTLAGRDALKAAGVILGLLATCIALTWVLTKSFHRPPPPIPAMDK